MKRSDLRGKWILGFAALMALVTFSAVSAHATATLSLSDGVNTIVVADGSALDVNPLAGVVTYVGSFGDWYLNVSTGVTYPAQGTPTLAYMDFNSVNGSSAAADLTLMFSQTDFVGVSSLNSAVMNIGGTVATNGSLAYEAFYSDANTLFDLDTLIGTLGAFGAGAFSGTTLGALNPTDLYSLTQVITLVHGQSGVSSYDAELKAVPEPGALLLLGSGILGLGLFFRRKKA